MTNELKTLKDLRGHGKEVWHPNFSDCINYDEETSGYDIDKIINLLRQEAIKWIKDIEKEKNEITASLSAWIMVFFNIVEEDLK